MRERLSSYRSMFARHEWHRVWRAYISTTCNVRKKILNIIQSVSSSIFQIIKSIRNYFKRLAPISNNMSAPAGEGINDNEYKSRPGQSEIPVVGNDSTIESGVNPATEDSDATLGMCKYLSFCFQILSGYNRERWQGSYRRVQHCSRSHSRSREAELRRAWWWGRSSRAGGWHIQRRSIGVASDLIVVTGLLLLYYSNYSISSKFVLSTSLWWDNYQLSLCWKPFSWRIPDLFQISFLKSCTCGLCRKISTIYILNSRSTAFTFFQIQIFS